MSNPFVHANRPAAPARFVLVRNVCEFIDVDVPVVLRSEKWVQVFPRGIIVRRAIPLVSNKVVADAPAVIVLPW